MDESNNTGFNEFNLEVNNRDILTLQTKHGGKTRYLGFKRDNDPEVWLSDEYDDYGLLKLHVMKLYPTTELAIVNKDGNYLGFKISGTSASLWVDTAIGGYERITFEHVTGNTYILKNKNGAWIEYDEDGKIYVDND
jgi:hypothetical protein